MILAPKGLKFQRESAAWNLHFCSLVLSSFLVDISLYNTHKYVDTGDQVFPLLSVLLTVGQCMLPITLSVNPEFSLWPMEPFTVWLSILLWYNRLALIFILLKTVLLILFNCEAHRRHSSISWMMNKIHTLFDNMHLVHWRCLTGVP